MLAGRRREFFMMMKSISSMNTFARRFTLATTVRPASGSGVISIALTPLPLQRCYSSRPVTTGGNACSTKPSAEKTLKSVLETELAYEKEEAESDPIEVPKEVFEHFKAHGLTISKDTPGDALVVLSGEKNGTKLSLSFDVRQVYLNELADDDADVDENVATEDETYEDEELDSSEDGLEPVAAKLVLTRGSSSLSFEISLYSGGVEVHSMHTGALPLDSDIYSSNAFTGPNYADLSSDLQDAVTGYLETLGINGELADVLRAYMDVKERKEYIAWLNTVRDFFKQ